MTVGRDVGQPSPLGLRLVHAALFLAFAAGVVVASVPEWTHLAQALRQPFHAGGAPRWLVLAGALLAVVGTARLGWDLVRGRSAPLWASGGILLGVMATLAGGKPQGLEQSRSEVAANLELLRVARRVHLQMVHELQSHGETPRSQDAWRAALQQSGASEARVFTRAFRPVLPQLAWLPSESALPEPLVPGQLAVHVTPDGVGFTVRLVGLEKGQPVLLEDDQGAPLVLRGLYNPDLPPPSQQALPHTP
ncbi:hypothetical protein [Corallococcus macrosporus]|uniref:Uncharacterized protein n=1 Tax=Myxococcus fulvus (strain ATCC BAA-855 / HW-1) TaxID=483219 RepID=F8C702_MYXFH|nr:hypothetical protein [Corallococcus macrosporus]AEI68123.1 hypothetical protein LILAB_31210 [Corallococcus macrosporus]